MKNWSRVLGVAATLVLATFASASAQFPAYGTCSTYCWDDGQFYVLENKTYGQCCFNVNQFSPSCYQVGAYWNPYGEGESLTCGG